MRTRVVEFDIDQPSPVWGLESYQSARILVRSSGHPIGWITLPVDSAMPVLTADVLVQAVGDQLGPISASSQPETGARPPITVVVCTRDRPIVLEGCLESLSRLDYPDFEVIVVDNASRGPETAELAAAVSCKYVREDRPGLDIARNCGAQAATNDIIAYTDDDVRVDAKWLDGIARGFSEPDISGVTGLICPLELETPAQRLFEQYGGMGKGFQPKLFDPAQMSPDDLLTAHNVGVGANMAFRRLALEAVGGFDPALDVGTPSAGAGDLDMFHRLLTSGRAIRYEPTALVWHQHRRAMFGLHKQIYSNGRAFGCYLLKTAARRSIPTKTVVSFACRNWIGGWLLNSFLHRKPGRNFALVAAESWGALHAPWAYLSTYRKLPWM